MIEGKIRRCFVHVRPGICFKVDILVEMHENECSVQLHSQFLNSAQSLCNFH